MPVVIPTGVVPVRSLTTNDILYGSRTTSYRWEVLTHSAGVDTLAGYLDGVVIGSATLTSELYSAVKGAGNLKVADLATAQSGFMRVRDLALSSVRLRPVLLIDGLPEIPLGVYLVTMAPEEWSDTGRVLALELHDRSTVLDQDTVDSSYTVDTSVGILAAVATVIGSAGESITVDATVTTALSAPMVWVAGTTKLQIVNDLLKALNYNSLWVDGVGNFRATPYIVPASRSLIYELLNVPRELVDGATSIYEKVWTRDKDMFSIPNKVIAVQSATGAAAALTGTYTNTNPLSPFSYANRGNRWITSVLPGVQTPAGVDAVVVAFLQGVAQRSLIAQSAPQASIQVKCLPVPIKVGDVLRFANVPAGIDARHVVASISLDASPLGLMSVKVQEVVSL